MNRVGSPIWRGALLLAGGVLVFLILNVAASFVARERPSVFPIEGTRGQFAAERFYILTRLDEK